MNISVARAIAVVRILVGIAFLCVGIGILMNHDLLFGGVLRHLTASGGPVRYYNRIVPYIERRETLLAYFFAGSCIGAGLFYVVGMLTSLTSLVASALVMNYALLSSSGHWPRFLTMVAIAIALLLLGRLAAGCTWGADGWLVARFKDRLVLFPLRRKAPELFFYKQTERKVAESDK